MVHTWNEVLQKQFVGQLNFYYVTVVTVLPWDVPHNTFVGENYKTTQKVMCSCKKIFRKS